MPLFSSAQSSSSLDEALTPIVLPPLEQSERGRSRAKEPWTKPTRRSDFRSPISPDRFIPQRRASPSTPFRVNKHPLQLSPQERFFRQRSPGDDPFLPSSHSYSLPENPGQLSTNDGLQRTPRQRPRLVTDSAIIGSGPSDFLRPISSGTIWGVGGNTAISGSSLTTTNNGPQSVLMRGSTAPNYVARFLPRKTKADEQKRHESRIALALDIDTTTRLLGTCLPSLQTSPDPLSPAYERFAPFVWKSGTWKKGERAHCKFAQVKPQFEVAFHPSPMKTFLFPHTA